MRFILFYIFTQCHSLNITTPFPTPTFIPTPIPSHTPTRTPFISALIHIDED